MKSLLYIGYRKIFLYFSALGFALTLLEALDPLLKLSKIARLILMHWEDFIINFWTSLLFFIKVDLSPEVYKALTGSLFFLALGVFSNERIVLLLKNTSLQFSPLDRSISYLFNILFLLGFAIINLINFYESTMEVSSFLQILRWSSPILIFSYSLFFVSVKISIAPLLRKKILLSIVILLTIIILDGFYEPLKTLLSEIIK